MISRILVTLDGSDLAEKVLPYAKDLVTRLNAQVVLLRVVEPKMPEMMMSEFVSAEAIESTAKRTDEEKKEASDYLSSLAAAWKSEGIDARSEALEGDPASKIIDFARAQQIDLIAMSTHGRSGLSKLVYGSVADRVLRECGTPILLIKAAGPK